ncbi:RNA polymerase II C-terminal domain phosphatase-like [Heracleum sosnowskyi]|uniref:RNA polymerase II C-terminal domain phosphatase-like n=1 Tax=Heracleum sosnowskyi TaxID=360622 RepID=A0AAD8IU63_9APIA|nr:RNA polymerase II C-terminal domain phosphatase-like [Heracleum sosnowskyi]
MALTIQHRPTMGGRPVTIQCEEYARELKLVYAKIQTLIELNGFQILRNQKKLCLVLDLDHTLLHTKRFSKLSPRELIREQISWKNDDFFTWTLNASGVKYLTKIRPFVRKFLQEASKLFELYVYTHGTRDYARAIVGFLDPYGVYFGSRVISREDSPTKGLKDLVVVPVHKSGVIILDDTEKVWARDRSNLVVIKPYNYFAPDDHNGCTRSLFEEGMDESESAGPLSRALGLLEQVHKSFFECHNIFQEPLRILLDNNGIHREKLQGIKDGYSLCDLRSRKRKSVNDRCPSAKRQRCYWLIAITISLFWVAIDPPSGSTEIGGSFQSP